MRKDRDFGRPNLIYLGKLIIGNQESIFLQFKNCKNYNSETEKTTSQDMKKLQLINNTNINKTNISDKEVSQLNELEQIKEKSELRILEEQDEFGNVDYRKRMMFEDAIERLYYSQNIKIDDAIIPQALVRSKLKQINGAIICYALEKLNNNLGNTKKVTNSTKYLMSCIYNAITEYYSDAEIQYKIDCLN